MGGNLINNGRFAALFLALTLTSACSDLSAPGAHVLQAREVQTTAIASGQLTLPNSPASVKFAVIGDSGRGSRLQRELAEEMTRFHQLFPFDFVIMLGDNIYEGAASPDDYRRKFEEPYAEMLAKDVDFYAVLGNHDDMNEVNYHQFHMKGHRYYTFTPPGDLLARLATHVEFFALDTTRPDAEQLSWLDERLSKSDAEWKICLTHHPLYTSGRYRNTALLYRRLIEPILVNHGVDVVFSGHEHVYQRSRLQNGIQYFISGGAGSIRPGEGVSSPVIASSYADDLHFMLIEIDRDELHFQTISRGGKTIDAGSLEKRRIDDVRAADTAARH